MGGEVDELEDSKISSDGFFPSLILKFRPIPNRIPEYHHFEEQL